jgi:hypothetical protein
MSLFHITPMIVPVISVGVVPYIGRDHLRRS